MDDEKDLASLMIPLKLKVTLRDVSLQKSQLCRQEKKLKHFLFFKNSPSVFLLETWFWPSDVQRYCQCVGPSKSRIFLSRLTSARFSFILLCVFSGFIRSFVIYMWNAWTRIMMKNGFDIVSWRKNGIFLPLEKYTIGKDHRRHHTKMGRFSWPRMQATIPLTVLHKSQNSPWGRTFGTFCQTDQPLAKNWDGKGTRFVHVHLRV